MDSETFRSEMYRRYIRQRIARGSYHKWKCINKVAAAWKSERSTLSLQEYFIVNLSDICGAMSKERFIDTVYVHIPSFLSIAKTDDEVRFWCVEQGYDYATIDRLRPRR